MDLYKSLYTNVKFLAGTGVADVMSDKTFRILVAHFSDYEVDVLPHQVLATAWEHIETLVESHISHAEVFGLILDDRDAKYRKRHMIARDIVTINKHLADHREHHMVRMKKPITAEDIDIDVPDEKIAAVRDIL